MHKKNHWIRSGTYSMLQRFSAVLFGFGSYFFLVRYFSIDDFGVWALYTVVSTSVEMSRSAFIQNAFVKFFNEEGTDHPKLFTASLFLNAVSTVIFILALLALTPLLQSFWHSTTIGTLIRWYCGISLILILFTQLNYLEQANHSFAGVFWSAVVRQGTFFGIVTVCFVYFPGQSLTFFAAAQLLSALLGLLTSFLFTRRMIPGKLLYDRLVVQKLFKFGKYILGTGITSTMGKNADQVILGGVSHSMAALYNAGVRILNLIEIPSLAISNIVYPRIAERASKEGASGAGELYAKSVGIILGLILPVVLVVLLFAETVLRITAGERYLEDAGALRIMAGASLLMPFNIQIGSVCEVMNRPHASFYINLVSNILNVILNIIFIRFFGVLGAATAFALTVAFIFATGQWYVRKEFGISGIRALSGVAAFYKEGFSTVLKYIRKTDA